ncbi:hypothetical protein quinque_016252 [Culex quinquefasciatus]
MNFNDLENFADLMLTLLGEDLEPVFSTQSAAVNQWDAKVHQNCDMVQQFQPFALLHYHPIVAVMAAHTEILTGLESQLDAIEHRLATNGEQIRKLGPAGDRQGKSWRELFGKLLGTK